MSNYPVHVAFPGRLIFVGFGSIGQGVLPLILRHVGIQPDQITIVTAEEAGEKVAAEYGVRFIKHPLTRENHKNDWLANTDNGLHQFRLAGWQS